MPKSAQPQGTWKAALVGVLAVLGVIVGWGVVAAQ